MKKILKRVLIAIVSLVAVVVIVALVLAFLPQEPKSDHHAITATRAERMRTEYAGPHEVFKTTDGETLFLRKWLPDSVPPGKKDIAVLLYHGITAHSGAYNMGGEPISAGGYTMFGLDYRGHGLSGGNRGDSPGKDRWITDLAEAILYIKSLGFQKVVIMGHSLGVASAILAANKAPGDIAGVILLSGAYEGRKGLSEPISTFEKARLLSSAVFRPSHPAAEYYRKGMTVTKDSLFTFKYTVRFLSMLDVKTLRIESAVDVPILVGAGDQDELFEVEKVKELYELIPGNKKEFIVMKNTTHAKIPVESWQQIVDWLDRTY
jgi:acylglycerol lipase